MEKLEEEIGAILYLLRERAGIAQGKLCEGLCSVQMLSKIELGERMPDKLLFDTLIQRLGKSPDKFEIMLSVEEYKLLWEREEIQQNIIKEQYLKAEEKLEQYIERYGEDNHLQRQYQYRIRAVLAKMWKKDDSQCMGYLIKAIEQTVPDWKTRKHEEYLLGVEEINLLLMLMHEWKAVGRGKEAEPVLRNLQGSVWKSYTDEAELVKVYPKCVYLWAQILKQEGREQEYLNSCERAFELLTSGGVTYFLSEIMTMLIHAYNSLGSQNRAKKLDKQRNSLEEMYGDYNYHINSEEIQIFQEVVQREYLLSQEIIQGERQAKGMTQESLAEGIYDSVESLSRVENGKSSPSRKKYSALMEKLEINKTKFSSYITVKEFEALELKRKIDLHLSRHEYEEAKIDTLELEKQLDMEQSENRQYIVAVKATEDKHLGIISNEQELKMAEEALALTYEGYKTGNYRIPFTSEAEILNRIAVCLGKLGGRREAIELLKKIIQCYAESRIDLQYHYKSSMPILCNLADFLEAEGETEEAIQWNERGIQVSLNCGRGLLLDVFLTNEACAMEKLDGKKDINRKACEKKFRQAFYLSDLFKSNINRNTISDYYKTNYNNEIDWY